MPDKPIPEQDPITSKSYAAHYLIATVILIITLFWALWDEALGQRPWKAFQGEWRTRYSAFLNTARSKSQTSEKDIESNSDYTVLNASWKKASQDAAPQMTRCARKLDDANARLLAVQSVFTDRRAYVNALTYESKPAPAPPQKPARPKRLGSTKTGKPRSSSPTGAESNSTSRNWKKTYNEIRDEKTKISLELGEVGKPATEAKTKMDEYITDHWLNSRLADRRA